MIAAVARQCRSACLCAALGGLVCVGGLAHAQRPLAPRSLRETPVPRNPLVQSTIQLKDVTRQTGITFVHTDGSSGRRYIVETVSAGLALFDYDQDGDVDIYFLNGARLPGSTLATPPKNALYRNDGGLRFTDVTDQAGVGDTGYGLGVAVGDYDNDGDLDLYVNNFGPNVLYRNNGDGTFADVTQQAGVDHGDRVGAGANFLDIDKDGDLDLFVANYLVFSLKDHKTYQHFTGRPTYPGPEDYPPIANALYRNDGGGTFTDISAASGIAAHLGKGMGTVCADVDNDGDTDIVVANDSTRNFLFLNDGTGKFEEMALLGGIACDSTGNTQSSMGVACGDYDNDGWLDLHQTSYEGELALLYRNLGDGFFEDATRSTGAGAGTLNHVTWGNAFVDFDNDGDKDIFIACGHTEDNIELHSDTTSYMACNVLLMNTGDGHFANVSDQAGDGLAVKLVSRGAAFDDLDGDGDVDGVILNSRREPTILRNDSPGKNHWLKIRLLDPQGNRDGVGAQVRVVAGDLAQLEEVHSGQGYQSHFGMQPHFGLGRHDHADRIEVRWIGGAVDVLQNVPADRLLTIRKGDGAR